MNKSRCVMMQLCVYSASSCGVRLAHLAGNSKNSSDNPVLSLLQSNLEFTFSSVYSEFVSMLTDDALLLLLNEAVGQLAISSGSAVGAASISLMLLLASQQELRVHRCLLSFKGQPLILSISV